MQVNLPKGFDIKLHSFCGNCKFFESSIDQQVLYGNNYDMITYNNISCSNYDICKKIYEHILKKEQNQ